MIRPTVVLTLLAGLVLGGLAAPAHAVQPTPPAHLGSGWWVGTPQPPKPCSNTLKPPPPVDTSEQPPPGKPGPKPLPVPDEPVGGPRMGECRLVLPETTLRLPSKVWAASWVVVDLDSGEVLAAKDPHGRHRPASLIKVLLALVVLDELDPAQIVQATKLDASQECTCIGVQAWQKYSVHKLFTGLLMSSGNDAAHTLGSALGGNGDALAKMNAMARALRALDTRAATTSGLDGPGMSSSAYDQALIFRAAMRQPRFAKAVQTRELRFRWHRRKPPWTLYNDNRLLSGPAAYSGFLGGKTGFTDDARHTYVGAARRGGKRLAVVLMRAEQKPLRVSEQARRLLDYGFRLAARDVEPVGRLVEPTAAAAVENPADEDTPGSPASSNDGSNAPWLLGLFIIGSALLGGFLLRRKPRG